MSSVGFFDEMQGAAVLKHGLLHRYLRIWAQKVGSRSSQGVVHYLDGFAGPGAYADGAPGSPALAVQLADLLGNQQATRSLRGICVEEDVANYSELAQFLEGRSNWRAIQGSLHVHLPSILEETPGQPLFAFFDPFGLSVTVDEILTVLRRNGKTEVLLNFSLPGLHRNAGHLTSQKDYPARSSLVERMDRAMGGPWWQELWSSPSVDRDEAIVETYIKRICEASGFGAYWTPVSDRWDGAPSYYLILFTQHLDGHWHFNESLSLAWDNDYRAFCERAGLQGRLDDMPELWVAAIKSNLERLIQSEGSVRLRDHLSELYGSELLGRARELHLRKAARELHAEGLLEPAPKGDLSRIIVRRPN